MNILNGVRVLDFGRYIAGPYCAALLAELGADVIRIEKVAGSEDRYYVPVGEDAGALLVQMARRKRGITLNPMKPEGREVVRKLVATADVVVANLPQPTLQQMGLDLESLRAVKADIILTTTSAYGNGGPYSERVGFDGIGQAMCGAMHLSGDARTPMKSYVPWVDFGTALMSAFGTLARLMERGKTGRGGAVETSLLGTALTFNNAAIIEQALVAPDRVGTGNRGQTSGPSDCFRTRDGWVLVQIVGNPLFARWAELIGAPELCDDPRFASDAQRGIHRDELSARMAEWCAGRSREEVLAALDKARIPAGPVLSPAAVMHDPHVAAMGFFAETLYPGTAGPAPVSTFPVTFSDADPLPEDARAPGLGEHTDRIMAELGYDGAAIEALREKRVI